MRVRTRRGRTQLVLPKLIGALGHDALADLQALDDGDLVAVFIADCDLTPLEVLA
jgi:hypothetical protein